MGYLTGEKERYNGLPRTGDLMEHRTMATSDWKFLLSDVGVTGLEQRTGL